LPIRDGQPMTRTIAKLVLAVGALTAAQGPASRDWVSFGQDPGATKHSALTQITTENVKNLKRAWVFHTGDSSGFFESTPLVIDGILYFSAPNGVFAVDGVTGQQIWTYATAGTDRG